MLKSVFFALVSESTTLNTEKACFRFYFFPICIKNLNLYYILSNKWFAHACCNVLHFLGFCCEKIDFQIGVKVAPDKALQIFTKNTFASAGTYARGGLSAAASNTCHDTTPPRSRFPGARARLMLFRQLHIFVLKPERAASDAIKSFLFLRMSPSTRHWC